MGGGPSFGTNPTTLLDNPAGRFAPSPDLVTSVTTAAEARDGRRRGADIVFRCPSGEHEDRHPSARWNAAKAVWRCDVCEHGGGAVDLGRRLGVEPPPPEGSAGGRQPRRKTGERRWSIKTVTGEAVAVHCRADYDDGTKQLHWERPDGSSGLGGLPSRNLPLYGIDEIGDAAEVVLVEGEQARDALARLGIPAVGTVTGAASCPSDDSLRPLVGRDVTPWPDADDEGQGHIQRIAERLLALGQAPERLRRIAWHDAPPKGDAADFVAAGGTAEAARALIAAAPPFVSAAPKGGGPAESNVPFRSAPEVAAAVSAEPEPTRPMLAAEARHGLAGDVVAAIEPHTEGDSAALLVNYLVMVGIAIGGGPYVAVGGARHGVADFAAQVGETAKARKGTAHADTHRIVREADPTWAGTRVTGGLSSGEGLVYPIRDPVETTKKGETVVTDPGESDKRLLVVEEEFSAVLKVATREGNTLTEQLRKAWDGRQLGVMTRNSPLRATGGHVGILAHITKDELLRVFDSTDAANGFGNRFAWFVVGRSKILPEGGRVPDGEVAALVARTRDALAFARTQGEVRRDDEARELWADVYPSLSGARPGLLGALTARAEAHVLRWSLLYALLDLAPEIRPEHLLAALSLWDYAEASARFVFGDATGDPVADRILAALRANGPMAQTEVVDLFGRNVNGARLGRAQEDLVRAGLVRSEQEASGGRPRTVWRPA